MHMQEGDVVAEFDKLCEVQSDKATVEISSQFAGRIARLRHDVGDMVQVPELNSCKGDQISMSLPQDVHARADEPILTVPVPRVATRCGEMMRVPCCRWGRPWWS